MNVYELIKKLEEVEDKSKKVILSVTLYGEEDIEYYDAYLDSTKEGVVNFELSN